MALNKEFTTIVKLNQEEERTYMFLNSVRPILMFKP